MAKDALSELHPSAIRIWDEFEPMVQRLHTKRPIIYASAPTATKLRVTSNRGSQPMFGMKDKLTELCGVVYEEPSVYVADEMTEASWLEFQNLCTFWGVVVVPEPPLVLNAPQKFACVAPASGGAPSGSSAV